MHNLSYILVIIWKWSQIMISCETWTNGQYYDEAEGCEWAGGWGGAKGRGCIRRRIIKRRLPDVTSERVAQLPVLPVTSNQRRRWQESDRRKVSAHICQYRLSTFPFSLLPGSCRRSQPRMRMIHVCLARLHLFTAIYDSVWCVAVFWMAFDITYPECNVQNFTDQLNTVRYNQCC